MKRFVAKTIACAVLALSLSAGLASAVAFASQSEYPFAAGAAGVSSAAPTNDPDLSEQWALEAIDAYGAWDQVKTDGAVTVAVIDNGFLVEHEDLKDNIVATYNAVTGSTKPADVAPFKSGSYNWHGTHVCGIIAASANNSKGIAGVSYNAKLLPIKVFTSSTEATSADIAKAFDFIIEHAEEYNIKVINFSGGHAINGWDYEDDLVLDKIQQAYDAGILTVCAAGNSATSGPYMSFPGDVSDVALNVISLDEGATPGSDPVRSSDSNYNMSGQKTKDIAAPGGYIWSCALMSNRTDWYRYDSGTSMAAPCVAGAAALVYAANETATAQYVSSILCQTATDLGAAGWDAEYGYGMVNANAAVSAALNRQSIDQAEVTLSSDTFMYDGTPKTPEVTVTFGGETLAAGEDYQVEYANNTEAGTATVTVRGICSYKGAVTREFVIQGPQLSDCAVSGVPRFRYRTGEPIKPTIEVEHEGELLELGRDYRVSYEDNTNVGTAHITVTGRGNYEGTLEYTFQIVDKPVFSGAALMPVGSRAAWNLQHCTLKVMCGKDVCEVVSGKIVRAKRAGTARIGVINDAGVCVSVESVLVYD